MSVQWAKAVDRLAGGTLLRAAAAIRGVPCSRPEVGPVRELVAVKFWGIGNGALLLPVLRSLRRVHPAARLTMVTLRGNEAVYRGAVDRVLTVRMRPLPAALLDLLRVAAALRADRPDLALDFEQYVRSSQLLLLLSGARRVVAFGTEGLRRAGLAHEVVPCTDAVHAGDSFLALGQAAGVPEIAYRPGGLRPSHAAAGWAADWCRRAGVGGRPLVVVHPGSGDNFPGRRWPVERFGALAGRLAAESGAVVAVTGTRSEAPLGRAVLAAARGRAFDLCGALGLEDLIGLLARASLLVANDTGPVHLGAALGVPVLGLYGPNSPQLYGPRSPGSRAFYRPPPCSPCLLNRNYKTSRCLNPVCILSIGVDEVFEAARSHLQAPPSEAAGRGA